LVKSDWRAREIPGGAARLLIARVLVVLFNVMLDLVLISGIISVPFGRAKAALL
jgi:hypothetical protein